MIGTARDDVPRRVAVVGGGITGLLAAVGLADAIVDARRGPTLPARGRHQRRLPDGSGQPALRDCGWWPPPVSSPPAGCSARPLDRAARSHRSLVLGRRGLPAELRARNVATIAEDTIARNQAS
jgi:glycine/D-amino acid oxidase-like deaminating enzyme